MESKKILIIFPYPHLAYSPTMVNMSKLLVAGGHNVKIVYGFEDIFEGPTPSFDGIELEKISYSRRTIRLAKHLNRLVWAPIAGVLKKLSLCNSYNRLSVRELLFSRIIKKALLANKSEELIVVDILALFWAQQYHRECYFVSLEVDDGSQLAGFLDTSKIKAVVTQSPERFERIFGKSEVKRFFVPNAPVFVEPTRRTTVSLNLIYNGTVWAPFGAVDIIEFVRRYPEYKVHFQGSIHPHFRRLVHSRHQALITSGALSLSETYIEDMQLRDLLADYSIGFCLYDFSHPVIAQRRFNYETAPSGKVYLYLSVGMPVVATRIKGFDFLEEKKAGILVDNHEPETLKNAVDTILNNYETFSENALEMGRSFSFEKSARPFIDFVGK